VDTNCLIFSLLIFAASGSVVETLSSVTICSSCVDLASQDSGRWFSSSNFGFSSALISSLFISSSAFDRGRESDFLSCSVLHVSSGVVAGVVV